VSAIAQAPNETAGQPGPAGPQGPKGKPGAPGTNGTNGTNGVSVTTASEPAGTNCAGGGVQLSAVNGVSYVCNGKDGKDGTNGTNGADGAPGPQGPQGNEGPQGAPGPQGPAGVSGYEIQTATVSAPAQSITIAAVDCSQGKHVLGGGATPSLFDPGSAILRSAPSDDTGWAIAYYNGEALGRFPVTVTVHAICATVG